MGGDHPTCKKGGEESTLLIEAILPIAAAEILESLKRNSYSEIIVARNFRYHRKYLVWRREKIFLTTSFGVVHLRSQP